MCELRPEEIRREVIEELRDELRKQLEEHREQVSRAMKWLRGDMVDMLYVLDQKKAKMDWLIQRFEAEHNEADWWMHSGESPRPEP